jgi:hypothetical protein
MRFRADVDSAVQERACGDYYTRRTEASSFQGLHTHYSPISRIEDKSGNGALYRLQAFVLLEKRSNGPPVEAAIALCTRRPDSGALASVEHAELNHGEVGGPAHDSSKRIDLADDGSFGDATDGGIARHLANRFKRTRNQPNTRAEASGSNGCFRTSVAGADNYNIEFGFKVLPCGHTLR